MNVRDARGLAWQAEFDLLDAEIGGRIALRKRAGHKAARRAGMTLPSPSASEGRDTAVLAGLPRTPLTRHAEHRLKNRGITAAQVAVVTAFARPQRVHGATRYALDRAARELVQQTLPPEELRSPRTLYIVAVVADDGALITAGHRTDRLRRQLSHH